MFTGSKKELLDLIKRNGEISIDEAVEHTNLAKTSLREHLLQLERDGYIERDYVRSGAGRPSLEYRLTQKGNGLYPSHESKLIKEFIRYLKTRDEEETIEDFFRAFWDDRLTDAKNRMNESPDNDLKSRMETLKQMLDEEGFMPEFDLDEENSRLTIKECNCPFSEAVKETRLPCKLEEKFFKKIFGKNARRTSYIAEGDYSCNYEISLG